MNRLSKVIDYIVIRDLGSQFLFLKQYGKFPKFAILTFECSFKPVNFNSDNFCAFFTFLCEFVFSEKACFIKSKKDVSFFAIRKGDFVALKVSVSKASVIFLVLDKLQSFFANQIKFFNNVKVKFYSDQQTCIFMITPSIIFRDFSKESFRFQKAGFNFESFHFSITLKLKKGKKDNAYFFELLKSIGFEVVK